MPDVIAFDADVIGRRRTGDETVAVGVLGELAQRDGLPFDVLAYVRRLEDVPDALRGGRRVRPVEVGRGSNYLRTGVSLPLRISADRPALYHGNYVLPPGLRCPAVVTVHDTSYLHTAELMPRHDREAFRRFVPRAARRADQVVVVSEYLRQDLLATVPGLDPARVRVMHLAPPASFAPVTGDDELVRVRFGLEPGYVLFIGALQPRKNLLRLLDAYAATTAADGPELVLVGDVKQGAAELDEAIDRLRIGARVRRVPYQPPGSAELRALYGAAGVFAFPSLYEGFGLPIVEAMACGTPVLTSDATSMPEVADGAAVLVDPRSVDSIAEGLGRLLDDAALRASCRARGLERVAGMTWAAAADRLVEVWSDVVREHPPAARSVRGVVAGRQADVVAAVVSHGQADDAAAAVASLRAQGLGERLAIVAVANLVGDGTAEAIRATCPDCVLLEQPEPRSFAENQAVAFAAAPGRHLAVVNPDVVCEPGCLDALVRFLDEHPRCGAVAPMLRNADGSHQPSARRFPEPIGGLWRRTPLRRVVAPGRIAPWHELDEPSSPRPIDWALGALLVIRREAWDDVGGFDEAFAPAYVEEIDLQWRLWQRGWEVWQEPAAVAVHEHQAVTDRRFLDRRTAWHLRNAARFVRRHPASLVGGTPALARASRARG